jgi:eukaryotic-like serine/threonine-protein kinase
MAPEQAKQTVSEKTDLFNFGASLYRLLTGHHIPQAVPLGPNAIPLDETTWKRALKPVLERNRQCPKELAALVDKCLMFKPTQRPDSIGEVLEDLEELVKKYVKNEEEQLACWEWPG